ncbi:MAG: type I restriction enzyme HsdR N-terminal domain-containing protein [Methylotenera sp.]|nr:type I restriction enzyme HsdR N-terminal domain-containing protein [Methylotenera sp.]
MHTQIREEVGFTKGRIIVCDKLHTCGEQKRTDYIYYKSNIPLAVIEAKDNGHSIGQALNYAENLAVPFVFSSNGEAFLMHDRTGNSAQTEQELTLSAFLSPVELWHHYCLRKDIETEQARTTVEISYYDDSTSQAPRYYQANAINNTIEAVDMVQYYSYSTELVHVILHIR